VYIDNDVVQCQITRKIRIFSPNSVAQKIGNNV
jgi:hypothetical protein